MDDLLNLEDFERAAAERLPAGPLGYYASGADDEHTLRDNVRAWQRLRLLPRVLAGVSTLDLSTSVLETPIEWPVLVAPMALQRMACEAGERATAGAARASGTLMVLSTISNTPVEEVVAAGRATWFQLYVYRDRGATRELVQRVQEAGVGALIVTVDVPHLGRREADERNRFTMPGHLELPNVRDRGRGMTVETSSSALAEYAARQLDPALGWKDVEWLRGQCDLPIVLKGILHPEDARLAFEHGAAAVAVSNHGGRQLDTAVATADALPAVVEAARASGGEDAEVYVDGGIRRGTDVLKAMALGARAVLLGRPVLWGLAVAGQDGAARVLDLLRAEVARAVLLSGCGSLADVGPELIWRD